MSSCRVNGVMRIILPVGRCDICERPAVLRAVKRPVLHTLSLCRVCHGRFEFILRLSSEQATPAPTHTAAALRRLSRRAS
jgi:hypothetical protein